MEFRKAVATVIRAPICNRKAGTGFHLLVAQKTAADHVLPREECSKEEGYLPSVKRLIHGEADIGFSRYS
jgi:hypothetical protein